ncbi:MAG: hypothetical protein BWY63_03756 [Chloroflexi bacterium ADurb.Bin360]|nr:MAG: hypothetical protein BWY63_03756 [Chloroflexi bacterium ADurb.Bin360]
MPAPCGDIDLPANLLAVEIHTANHRQDIASSRFESDQGAVAHLVLRQIRHPGAHFFLGDLLQARVQGGMNTQACATIERLGTQSCFHLLPHVEDKMRCGNPIYYLSAELESLHFRCGNISLGLCDCPSFNHEREHRLVTLERRIQAPVEGIIDGGQLRQPRQEGSLSQRKIARRGAEIGARGSIHTVGKVPVVVVVQVNFQDFILAVAASQLLREDDFLHLAQIALPLTFFGGQQNVARDLLGNRAGTGDDFSLLQGVE